jgi:site-specific DNA-adenine methylase
MNQIQTFHFEIMWSYYGAKTNLIKYYPRPKCSKIIEPFAGTARYALQYFEKDVLLVDKYDVIVKIWQWLQKCSEKDIRDLPRFKAGDNINDHHYDCEEQRFLVGFLVGFGFTGPRKTATPRLRNRPNAMNYTIESIASQLFKIRHWKIEQGSYEDIPNQEASWFIDPPYQVGGHAYAHSNKKIDYNHLKEWCVSRRGQIIVCENSKADWMDFQPAFIQNVLSGRNYEVIWTNQPISPMAHQQILL